MKSVISMPILIVAGWSSPVARQAHNLKVVSSNLAPATNYRAIFRDFPLKSKNPIAALLPQNDVGILTSLPRKGDESDDGDEGREK